MKRMEKTRTLVLIRLPIQFKRTIFIFFFEKNVISYQTKTNLHSKPHT